MESKDKVATVATSKPSTTSTTPPSSPVSKTAPLTPPSARIRFMDFDDPYTNATVVSFKDGYRTDPIKLWVYNAGDESGIYSIHCPKKYFGETGFFNVLLTDDGKSTGYGCLAPKEKAILLIKNQMTNDLIKDRPDFMLKLKYATEVIERNEICKFFSDAVNRPKITLVSHTLRFAR